MSTRSGFRYPNGWAAFDEYAKKVNIRGMTWIELKGGFGNWVKHPISGMTNAQEAALIQEAIANNVRGTPRQQKLVDVKVTHEGNKIYFIRNTNMGAATTQEKYRVEQRTSSKGRAYVQWRNMETGKYSSRPQWAE